MHTHYVMYIVNFLSYVSSPLYLIMHVLDTLNLWSNKSCNTIFIIIIIIIIIYIYIYIYSRSHS